MKKYLGALLIALLLVAVAIGQNGAFRDLGRIPIQHEGRIKPLDSFARIQLRHLTSHESIDGAPAIAWLTMVVFEPENSLRRPLFSLADHTLQAKLGLSDSAQGRYSARDVLAAFDTNRKWLMPIVMADPADLTAEQNTLRDLYQKTSVYLDLLGSLTMLMKLDDTKDTSYLDLSKSRERLHAEILSLVKRKGQNLKNYTPSELERLRLGMRMDRLNQAATASSLFKIIPSAWNSHDAWLTPWEALTSGHGSPQGMAYLKRWQDLMRAYHGKDSVAWSAALDALAITAPSPAFPLAMEQFYNTLQPFAKAETLYVLGLIFLAIAFRWRRASALRPAAIAVMTAGVLLHAGGIGLRIAILNRPPVGTLYESILFVSLVISAVTLFLYHRLKDHVLLGGGTALSLGLLLIAPSMAAQGDSMEVLVAVLNTNFWLATHVVCITAAYATCIFTALLAHIELYKGALTRKAKYSKTLLHKSSLVALFLTAFGTVLGGIWADQSWGRFWGWDPKENGALLIVLWLIWMLHGRLSGHLKELGFRVTAALLMIIVSLSWFGVNLLNVGLHSYGFISGIAWSLGIFCLVEILFIGLCASRIRRHASC